MTSASPSGRARSTRRHPEAAVVRAARGRARVPVNVIAGWIASGTMSLAGGRLEDRDAVRPGRVHDELAGREGAGRAEPRDEVGEGVVGHGEHARGARPATTSGIGLTGTPGSRVAARSRLASLTAETPVTTWPARAQGGPEDGPDAAGAHDADVEARGTLVRGAHPRHAIAYSPEAWIPFPGATRGTTRCMPPGAVSTSRAVGPPRTSRRPRTAPTGRGARAALLALPRPRRAAVVVDLGAGRGELATAPRRGPRHPASRYAVAPSTSDLDRRVAAVGRRRASARGSTSASSGSAPPAAPAFPPS